MGRRSRPFVNAHQGGTDDRRPHVPRPPAGTLRDRGLHRPRPVARQRRQPHELRRQHLPLPPGRLVPLLPRHRPARPRRGHRPGHGHDHDLRRRADHRRHRLDRRPAYRGRAGGRGRGHLLPATRRRSPRSSAAAAEAGRPVHHLPQYRHRTILELRELLGRRVLGPSTPAYPRRGRPALGQVGRRDRRARGGRRPLGGHARGRHDLRPPRA